jgi:predicted nucleic acid-binding Zn ribbon protein
LNALFSADGNYRFTSQQASTRDYFDRTPASFKRQKNGLLLTGQSGDRLAPGGAATRSGHFITLADTDASDGDISVTYLMPGQTKAKQSAFNGTYFCGHILSNGQSLFFRATMNGKGSGAMAVISRRLPGASQAAISYEVSEDGTTIFEYAGARLAGSLSAVTAQLQGAGMCVRTSGNKTVANVAGSYYGAWMSTQPVTGLTELLLDQRGQTVETVLVDSTGGRNYSLGQNFMLVKGPGQVDTRDANGAVSPDGRVMFIVQTDPNKFPTLVVYIRKT